jgi:hypothetical protein
MPPPNDSKIVCDSSIAALDSISAIFRLCCGARCDSKANAADKSTRSQHFAVNFSFANQRADSFLVSGVNLEAKV